jgi:hypothetical protein
MENSKYCCRNFVCVVLVMNQREKVLARREFILETVKAGGATVKGLSKELKVSLFTVKQCIHDIGDIHWQDDVLYYGDLL